MPFCYQAHLLQKAEKSVEIKMLAWIFSQNVVHHLPFGERSSLAQGNIELYPYQPSYGKDLYSMPFFFVGIYVYYVNGL